MDRKKLSLLKFFLNNCNEGYKVIDITNNTLGPFPPLLKSRISFNNFSMVIPPIYRLLNFRNRKWKTLWLSSQRTISLYNAEGALIFLFSLHFALIGAYTSCAGGITSIQFIQSQIPHSKSSLRSLCRSHYIHIPFPVLIKSKRKSIIL